MKEGRVFGTGLARLDASGGQGQSGDRANRRFFYLGKEEMMKRLSLSIAPLMAMALSFSAFAQEVKTGGEGRESTVNLQINGGWEMGYLSVTRDMVEIGSLGDTDEAVDSVVGKLWLEFRATIQDKVDIHLRVERPSWDADGVPETRSANDYIDSWNPLADLDNTDDEQGDGNLLLTRAVVTFKEVFDPNLSISFGLQDAVFDLRGKGNPIFLAAGYANSPYGDLDDAGDFEGASRDEIRFAGLVGTYKGSSFSVSVGLLQAEEDFDEVSNSRTNERMVFAHATFDAAENVKVGVIAAWFNLPDRGPGDGTGEEVLTLGGAVVFNATADVEVFAEFYTQSGEHDSDVAAAPDEVAGEAWQVGVRYSFSGEQGAWIELSYLSVSGSDGTDASDEEQFISYENNDDMLFFDSNEWGIDLDTNVIMIKVKGGLKIGNNLHLEVKIAKAEAEEDADFAAAVSEDYGTEIDVTVKYEFNKNASLFVTLAQLSGADYFVDTFLAPSDDEKGMMIMLGTRGAF